LLNKTVQYGRQHVIDRNLSLVRALGADVHDKRMELPVSIADDRAAKALLKPLGKASVVCISPGSGREEKNWLPTRWALVADALIEQYNARIVLTGSKREIGLIERIMSQMRHADKTLNLCGKTSLTQLAAVVKQCKLVLSPDSGTMHIARAMQTPLIGLFTVENAREWGYDEPRFQHIKKHSPGAITVDMVLDKINTMRCL
jgi:ADP-heptose:LPS heptosyltransferase